MFESFKRTSTPDNNQVGVMDNEEKIIEKGLKIIEKDPHKKKQLEFYTGKVDDKGQDQRAKFIKFVAEHPRDKVVYSVAKHEFEVQRLQNIN